MNKDTKDDLQKQDTDAHEQSAVVSNNSPVQYKRRRGDRKEGRRLRSITPMSVATPFIMQTRTSSQNFFSDSVDSANLDSFCHKKRREGLAGFGTMHVLAAAYVRAVSQRPAINRFISGYRVFARHSIEVNLGIKKSMTLDAPETMLKFFFDPRATVEDVYRIMTPEIEHYQNMPDDEKESDMDALLRSVGLLPRFILRSIVGFAMWLDYHGLVPLSFLKLSPFHGSLFLTSMGSLGIPPVQHHLYDFGNVPMFISFSAMRKVNELNLDGTIKRVRYLDLSLTLDDRVCDGFYYAAAFHELRKNLKNPELLDVPPQTVVEDVD